MTSKKREKCYLTTPWAKPPFSSDGGKFRKHGKGSCHAPKPASFLPGSGGCLNHPGGGRTTRRLTRRSFKSLGGGGAIFDTSSLWDETKRCGGRSKTLNYGGGKQCRFGLAARQMTAAQCPFRQNGGERCQIQYGVRRGKAAIAGYFELLVKVKVIKLAKRWA